MGNLKKNRNYSKKYNKNSKYNLFRQNRYNYLKYLKRRYRRYLSYGCAKFSHGLTRRFVIFLAKYYTLNIKRMFIPTSFLLKRKFKYLPLKNFFLRVLARRSNKILVRNLREKNPIYSLAVRILLLQLRGIRQISKFSFYRKNLAFNFKYLRKSIRRGNRTYFRFSDDCTLLPIKYIKTQQLKKNISILNNVPFFKHRNRTRITGFLRSNIHDSFFCDPEIFYFSKIVRERSNIFFNNLSFFSSGERFQKSKNNSLSNAYPLNAANSRIYHNYIHHKELFKIRDNEFPSVKYLLRKNYFKNLLKTRYANKKKFYLNIIKTNPIYINNKKINDSSFIYKRFFFKKFSYLLRTFVLQAAFFNRKTFRKKNWKFTKLNIKRHSPRSFLKRSLSFGFFRKQDSFRLLHIFRTIFLKYSFAYSSFNLLKFIKKLKNSLITHNSSNTFVDRFLWHIERSANILIYRSKYAPTLKTSNHLIRYGFFMLNNCLIMNPYTQISLLDVVRVAKTKYFLKLFMKDYLLTFGFRKKNIKPFYIELNSRILALSVFRKPKLNDFILSRKVISPRPETNWYLTLPTIAALF
jgi:hypothetical protein